MAGAAEIDWDDPDAVARARGDVVDSELDKDNDETPEEETDEEQPSKESEDETEEEGEKDEEETDEEDGDEDDGDEESGGDTKEPMLPKSRYDAANQKYKDAAARVEELEARIAEMDRAGEEATAKQQREVAQARDDELAKLQTTIDEIDHKIEDAHADGDRKLAAQLRQEQRQMERKLARAEVKAETAAASVQTREEVRLELTIEQLEEMYPQLDPGTEKDPNPEFDGALVAEILELKNAYLATKKYSPSQALLKATGMFMRDVPTGEAETETGEEENDDGVQDTEAQKKTRETRKKKALKKAVDAQKKQPPDTQGVGDDSDTSGIKDSVDPSKISLKDLDNMPLDELKRLRGDHRV